MLQGFVEGGVWRDAGRSWASRGRKLQTAVINLLEVKNRFIFILCAAVNRNIGNVVSFLHCMSDVTETDIHS